MIVTFDVETHGLNTHRFILGCIATDTGIHETFYNKEKMWQRILQLGNEESKRGHNLTCYAHNLAYDLYSIIDWEAQGLTVYSTQPLIIDYKNIKFIDSTGLYKGKLEDLGHLIGEPKAPTPPWLYEDNYEPNTLELWEAARYCMQDCNVLLKGIKKLKEKLAEDGVNVRTLITIGQCAINGYLTYLSKLENAQQYFKEGKDNDGTPYYVKRQFETPQHNEHIRSAYKGARVQVFKTGEYVTNMADVNSMYPYCMTTMRYPDLRTEHYSEPHDNNDFITNYLPRIGIARAHIIAEPDNVGTLAIRGEKQLRFANNNAHALGTWTHEELREALQHGAQLIKVFWSITWKESKNNPLKNYIETLYARRAASTSDYERWLYKQLMNNLYGKFAQHRTTTLYEIGHIDETEQRLNNGWEIQLATSATHNLYRKKLAHEEYKRFYAPIISALITAHARIHISRLLRQLPYEQLLYCDTDGIVWEGDRDEFKYSHDLGGLKLVHEHTSTSIVKKKTYRIGNELHASGIPRASLDATSFITREASYKHMITPFEAKNINDVGTFTQKDVTIEEEDDDNEEHNLLIDNDILTKETLDYLNNYEVTP